MKQLIDFILEYEKVGKLPWSLEKFKHMFPILSDACLEYDLDNAVYKEVMNWVKKKFGSKFENIFRNWICGYDFISDEVSLDDLYHTIENLSVPAIKKAIGAGGFGIAFNLGEVIMKVYYGNSIPNSYGNIDLQFYNFCKRDKSGYFPKIYRIGKNYIIMEPLQTKTPKCQKYIDILNKHLSDYFERSRNGDDTWNYNDPNDEGANDWFRDVKTIMDQNNFGFPGDININNIGERKDGSIVAFDI